MLKCTCGSSLEERTFNVQPLNYVRPKHKKKRIQKKMLKAYEKDMMIKRAMYKFINIMHKPYYVCISCNKVHSFYAAIGRNMFEIQPLPIDALHIYTKSGSLK